MLNDTQIKFLTLATQLEQLNEQIKTVKEQMLPVMTELGKDQFLQDTQDGTVYQIVAPQGKFVFFETLSYIRTRKADEDRGDLSLKKAEEAGFTLPAAVKAKK